MFKYVITHMNSTAYTMLIPLDPVKFAIPHISYHQNVCQMIIILCFLWLVVFFFAGFCMTGISAISIFNKVGTCFLLISFKTAVIQTYRPGCEVFVFRKVLLLSKKLVHTSVPRYMLFVVVEGQGGNLP